MPRVSVILPTYNRAQLVAEAIESVLGQTFADFELIVVDDGSTDNTEEVVRSFPDPRLRYLPRFHDGAAGTRNAGIQAALGEYAAFLDSDDLFLPEKLSLQVALIAEDAAIGLVYGKYLSTIGSTAGGAMRTAGEFYAQLDLRRLLLGPAFHWSTALVRRGLLEQVGGFDQTLGGEDWDLTLRLALAGCQMRCVPEFVSIVRRQPVSNTRDMRYMSTVLGILDKTFRDPRLPPALLTLRDMAHASQYLRVAASAFATSEPETGREFLQRALATCPSLAREDMDLLVDTLFYRVLGLSLEEPETALRRVTEALPRDGAVMVKVKSRLWGRFYEIAAFDAHEWGQRAECIRYLIRATVKNPSCLRNRGLVSLFVRSVVGDPTVEGFKRLVGLHRGAPVDG